MIVLFTTLDIAIPVLFIAVLLYPCIIAPLIRGFVVGMPLSFMLGLMLFRHKARYDEELFFMFKKVVKVVNPLVFYFMLTRKVFGSLRKALHAL